MLRVRFDTFDQLSRHLHVVGNAALLFLRDQKAARAPYGRVLLEVDVSETRQRAVVRGEVVVRAEGSVPGGWLQIADTRLARRVREGGGFGARRSHRVAADQMLQLRCDGGAQFVVGLLDVSEEGARVRGAPGLAAGQGCTVSVLGARPLHATLGKATVMRATAGEAALRFAEPGNPDVARYVQSLRDAWAHAREIEHLPGCCTHRGALDPLPPKIRGHHT